MTNYKKLLLESLSIIKDLIDIDECMYDHHGYCQTHSGDLNPCPHERAKLLLNKLKREE